MPAFYKSSVEKFLGTGSSSLMLKLTSGTAGLGFDLKADQHSSWIKQAEILRAALTAVTVEEVSAKSWGLLLEYEIPGRPNRLDAVLLDGAGIIAIEFKIGANKFRSGDKWQLREYCWDLRDFHQESDGVPIAPVLVATDANAQPPEFHSQFEDKRHTIVPLLAANSATLGETFLTAHARLKALGKHQIDLDRWDQSQTHTTRTVIEEAQRLFAGHNVPEISHAHADNTTEAQASLINIVRESREQGLRSICILTGVPGAGKTLVGLHAAYSPEMAGAAGKPACFASGNQPLLDVLHAALTLNRTRHQRDRREVGHELSAPVQNVHDFALRNLLDEKERAPNEHVVIFDEAQRVWNSDQVEKGIKKRLKRGRLNADQALKVLQQGHSEPELLLRVMERCPEWCVIVALVGGGQEIYDGEAGLEAWGKALAVAPKRWAVWVAPAALEGDPSLSGHTLFVSDNRQGLDVRATGTLHLAVGKRSPRAQSYAEWVNHLLEGQSQSAAKVAATLREFPVLLSRNLDEAKRLMREHCGERSRIGMVASSGAVRLRAEGIELKREFRNSLRYPDWFLRARGDIRSSNQLEIAATEFECQGLELDWTLVCWGGDFIRADSAWLVRALRSGKDGPRWGCEKDAIQQVFTRNKYRVLLTRARFGIVIYIPEGSTDDKTRSREEFDAVADFLKSCGAPTISIE